MIFTTLEDLEQILTKIKNAAEKYREGREALEAVEERWAKFVELAKAFGVELKLAEGVEFYASGPLPDNTNFIERLDNTLALIKRIKGLYGNLKIIIDIDFNIKKIMIKI
ncbi:MAG: hypothetical protein JZD41_02720 [Thermoproteus sp.]|nr:hypothetical protein [Thermoproteus sp.]